MKPAIRLIIAASLLLTLAGPAAANSFKFDSLSGLQDGMEYKNSPTTSYNGGALNCMVASGTDTASWAYVGDFSIDDTLNAHSITADLIDSVLIYVWKDITRNVAGNDTMLVNAHPVVANRDWAEASVCWNNYKTSTAWTTAGGDVGAGCSDTMRVTPTTGAAATDSIWIWRIRTGFDSLLTSTGNRGWRLTFNKAGTCLGNEGADFFSSEAASGVRDSIVVYYTPAGASTTDHRRRRM